MQALLEGISLSQPQPKLPSELIKFLGKTYNAWHIAIPLLESHVVLFPHVSCATAAADTCSSLSIQHAVHTARLLSCTTFFQCQKKSHFFLELEASQSDISVQQAACMIWASTGVLFPFLHLF